MPSPPFLADLGGMISRGGIRDDRPEPASRLGAAARLLRSIRWQGLWALHTVPLIWEVDRMAVPRDPYLAGSPLPPPAPRDPYAESVLDDSERGQDEVREDIVTDEIDTPARPLTDDEKDAAKHDAGRRPRTFAPASERVAKAPAPGDERIVEEGEQQPASAGATSHPGDRSDPSEFR